ncbi:MAG: GMP synthase subunit A [Candidatus Thermoplasmatota archaeon]|jgi:GMP synthase (glutamine-hydrolysing)|nr:GMP synthase subunit A [Candidatus Thermoplasmatota archaeon]MCL5793800.1 GMP synthase subunit A [Candidatus Thermoplasmatota archaeon]
MRIDVVDNGGQWTHKEWRLVRSLGVESTIIPNTTEPSELNDVDGLILSGGAPSIVSELDKLGNISNFIEDLSIPILGICVGAQFIALHFGGEVGPGKTPEFGRTTIEMVRHDGIFSSLPETFTAWENHNDEVRKLPESLVLAGSSRNCPVQAFFHEKRAIYGVQFHPEVHDTQNGLELFSSFVSVCRD